MGFGPDCSKGFGPGLGSHSRLVSINKALGVPTQVLRARQRHAAASTGRCCGWRGVARSVRGRRGDQKETTNSHALRNLKVLTMEMVKFKLMFLSLRGFKLVQLQGIQPLRPAKAVAFPRPASAPTLPTGRRVTPGVFGRNNTHKDHRFLTVLAILGSVTTLINIIAGTIYLCRKPHTFYKVLGPAKPKSTRVQYLQSPWIRTILFLMLW